MDFPDLKLKALVSFPASVYGGAGISVVKASGNYTINLDYSDFAVIGTIALSSYVLAYDPVTGSYGLASISVASSPSNVNPAMDGIAAPGASLLYSRGDHIHPTDTTRAPLAAPIFTGNAQSTNPPLNDNDASIATTSFVTTAIAAAGRNYLAGMTLSTAGASATFSVAAGVAINSTNTDFMTLAASVNKTTATWAVGTNNGSFDGTGAAPSATADWYHVYLIKRTDTGIVDVLTSRSATAPTMPSPYTLFRRIGSMKTNGSFQWIAFTQNGDGFRWAQAVQDVSAVNPGTSAVTRTLTVPTGVIVQPDIVATVAATTSAAILSLFTSLTETDRAPSATDFTLDTATTAVSGIQTSISLTTLVTNTLAQIRSRLGTSGTNDALLINTFGWIDRRGRDA